MAIMSTAAAITLGVQALPTLISAGEKIASKLDDNDENTGPLVEVGKAIANGIDQTLTDIGTINDAVTERAKAISDRIKSHF